MKITIVEKAVIPVSLYGGTQRVIWDLGKSLAAMGHQITYLVLKGSSCNFANVHPIDDTKSIISQIPTDTDIVHFHFHPEGIENLTIPYVITVHGNPPPAFACDNNSIFVSENHAARHNSNSYVYNGLDWESYLQPQLNNQRNYFHFLGKAAWRVKNVKGAIDIVKASKKEKLKVLGGYRFNVNMGFRMTITTKASFSGMVGGQKKHQLINNSKGLIFPVKWHEPFGLAIAESLFYGCPVFGTPYGSLPEIVTQEFGVLSNKKSELVAAILNVDSFSRKACHEYARDVFNHTKMAENYLKKYETVLEGSPLNSQKPSLLKTTQEKYLPWQD